MKRLRHIIRIPLKALSIAAAAALALSCLSIYINPAALWQPAFFGLFFLPLLAVNVALAIGWTIVYSRFAWVNICLVVPSLFYLPLFIQFNGEQNNTGNAAPAIKIVSYNVHLFGLSGGKTATTLSGIADFIKNENPDIICLQEVAAYDTTELSRTFKKYPYRHYKMARLNNRLYFGLATFSRYPMTRKGSFVFPQSLNGGSFADIAMHGKTVRIYNNHLQSVHLNLEKTAMRLQQGGELRNNELRNLSHSLKTGFIKRAQQVDSITAHIAAAPHPVIVCGDFNDIPMSYTYRRMKGKLNDCFLEAGRGMVSTYNLFWSAFRIDYIFSDAQFRINRYNVRRIKYSDHYPVVVELLIEDINSK
ncbi:MAG: endonuclease/exonuclease/phosphatase family protein [Prevotellaceae bacterium]|jgi:endonuclease/exonuclease/phosphatase family metal-dependent hydrolase|nr:endonuclease/exonuclease/phosphatase family protein [Prevotellaceae bacterium]